MISGLRNVDWSDAIEAIPAFLTLIVMSLAVSRHRRHRIRRDRIRVLKLAAGRGRDVHALLDVFAALFIARYVFLR